MRNQTATTWTIGALLCLWLSWRAWSPSNSPGFPEPTPLPRPASSAEREALNTQAAQLSEWIRTAQLENGLPIALEQVEAHLPQPIFDNPLVDGVGGIQESCPVEALEHPGLDWVYCPETGNFDPNIPDFKPR